MHASFLARLKIILSQDDMFVFLITVSIFINAYRYNEFGQPVCRVCDVVLKSDSLWDAHQVSRKHREVIIFTFSIMLCTTGYILEHFSSIFVSKFFLTVFRWSDCNYFMKVSNYDLYFLLCLFNNLPNPYLHLRWAYLNGIIILVRQ